MCNIHVVMLKSYKFLPFSPPGWRGRVLSSRFTDPSSGKHEYNRISLKSRCYVTADVSPWIFFMMSWSDDKTKLLIFQNSPNGRHIDVGRYFTGSGVGSFIFVSKIANHGQLLQFDNCFSSYIDVYGGSAFLNISKFDNVINENTTKYNWCS